MASTTGVAEASNVATSVGAIVVGIDVGVAVAVDSALQPTSVDRLSIASMTKKTMAFFIR